jgi:hypothetical protein
MRCKVGTLVVEQAVACQIGNPGAALPKVIAA